LRPDVAPTDAAASALEAEAIAAAAGELGVLLDADQAHTLARYAALLLRWNTVHNLTAIESPAQVLTHHLLDSLAIAPHVQRLAAGRSVRVLDVGAGGGLPGIPLAIAAPALRVTLVDKVEKKVAFLTQAKLELSLPNVETVHARVETLNAEKFEIIVARAFASLAQLIRCTRHLLAANGWWCAMKGALPGAELEELKRAAPDVRADTIKLSLPRLSAQRHLILMQVAS
jgi:16S rRNA (guanine527-N7)-methyltransferase